MKRLFAIALLFFPVACFAQITISGRVLNQADTKPIPDASVFLSNSSVGTKTADDGAFNLKNVKPGKYQLIISIIGFEKYEQTIIVNNSNIALPGILMFPKTTVLNEVSIKSVSDADRERYYNWFKEEFLGTSDLAKDCTIVNPEILNFDYDKKTDILTASSPDFLIVENEGLGYKIKYLLTSFSLDDGPSAKFHLNYEGSVLFERMKGTPSQEKRWQKRRQQVYEGSLMHFLRAALDDRIDQEGFRVLLLKRASQDRPTDSVIDAKIKFYKKLKSEGTDTSDSLAFWVKKSKLPKTIDKLLTVPLKKDDIIKPTDQQGLFAFGAQSDKDALYITYNKNQHFTTSWQPYYLNGRTDNETTLVDFDGRYAFFDSNGAVFNPNSLIFAGVWGRYRVAELLPVDYEPSQKEPGDSDAAAENLTANGNTSDGWNLKNNLLTIKAKSDSAFAKGQAEKLYLQFDKPYYALGDTTWFKAYLLNDFLLPSGKSGILNIDIANDSDKVVRKYRVPVQSGLAWGEIALEDRYFKTGTYTLRAYTNWMRNFGDDAYFYKTFTISSANGSQLLLNSSLAVASKKDSLLISGKLRFTNAEKTPFAVQPVILRITSGNKPLYHAKTITGADGAVGLGFALPQKAFNPAVIVENNKHQRLAVIPLPVNRPRNTDVQFLPEGGSLVAGLIAHIGFKAISEDGKGTDVYGVVVDQDNKQAATFKSLHNGMGSFDLDIKAGETYTAQVTLPDGTVKPYPAPQVKTTGTALSIKNEAGSDSLHITIAASRDAALSGESYYLIARARGIVCYAAVVNFNGGPVKRSIAKSLFPTGITHFTLMTTKDQPVNERLVFIDHHDDLDLKISANKTYYGARDSVALKLKVTDQDGDPVSADLSVAVTDDAQVKAAPNSDNIATHYLLTADLKGYIEQPAYYLSSKTNEAWQALDNLLLTQGWVGYNWSDVFNPQAPVFEPETELAVTGHVTNVLNKPVKGTDIMLFSKKPSILIDTATDSNGRFVFDRLPKIDTPVFVLRAVNKRGKSFNVNITVDETAPPVFAKPAAPVVTPWYVNTDSTLLVYTKNAALLKRQADFTPGGHILNEVKIKAKKIIKDSQNLNGPGEADFAMDEKDLEAAGKKTWLQLFEQNIKGFREIYYGLHSWFYIYDKAIVLIVDGIRVDKLYNAFDFKQYIEFHNAEDIKGLEVNASAKYTAQYKAVFNISPPAEIAFVEITTRQGSPIIHNTPGMYLYKPLPISWPKQFYKPKYKVTDTVNRLDYRATIDWEPNVVTDANGEATIWFYTADKPSTYTLRVEGTDMKGHLGFKQSSIKVGENEKTK